MSTELTSPESCTLAETKPHENALPVWTPRTDVLQTGEATVIMIDLPGVTTETLDVELENNALRVTGDAAVLLPEGKQWMRREVRGRRYSRTFRLGQRVDTEKLNARLANGVLTVTIPHKAETMARKIEISG